MAFNRKKWLQDPKIREKINAYNREWMRKHRIKLGMKPRKNKPKCAYCGVLLKKGDKAYCSECLKIPV